MAEEKIATERQEYKGTERRRYPRISWNFFVRFRRKGIPDSRWEMSHINNISEGGCFFISSEPYLVGWILEIDIQFPQLIKGYMRFSGDVKRCELDKNSKSPRYGIAVCFLEIDEEKRRAFLETINFFLRKQETKAVSE